MPIPFYGKGTKEGRGFLVSYITIGSAVKDQPRRKSKGRHCLHWTMFMGISAMLVDMNMTMGNTFIINKNLPVGHTFDIVGGLHEEVNVVGNKNEGKTGHDKE